MHQTKVAGRGCAARFGACKGHRPHLCEDAAVERRCPRRQRISAWRARRAACHPPLTRTLQAAARNAIGKRALHAGGAHAILIKRARLEWSLPAAASHCWRRSLAQPRAHRRRGLGRRRGGAWLHARYGRLLALDLAELSLRTVDEQRSAMKLHTYTTRSYSAALLVMLTLQAGPQAHVQARAPARRWLRVRGSAGSILARRSRRSGRRSTWRATCRKVSTHSSATEEVRKRRRVLVLAEGLELACACTCARGRVWQGLAKARTPHPTRAMGRAEATWEGGRQGLRALSAQERERRGRGCVCALGARKRKPERGGGLGRRKEKKEKERKKQDGPGWVGATG
eukprot:3671716-Pleurochrysis_carterae.AAC.1